MSESNCRNIRHEPSGFSAAPFPLEQAAFLARLMSDARVCRALHFRQIPDGEWRDVLATQDPDEQNFLIARDAEPVAWLRVNGLCGGDSAWISMLVVSPGERRRTLRRAFCGGLPARAWEALGRHPHDGRQRGGTRALYRLRL